MEVIVCVDDSMGMLFNHRRQSQDRSLRKHILDKTRGRKIWMNEYSAGQFEDTSMFCIDEDFLDKAGNQDVCFVENCSVLPYEQKIDKIVLYKWNRRYPGDFYFDIPMNELIWHMISSEDLVGNSHEKITEEVYVKWEKLKRS